MKYVQSINELNLQTKIKNDTEHPVGCIELFFILAS